MHVGGGGGAVYATVPSEFFSGPPPPARRGLVCPQELCYYYRRGVVTSSHTFEQGETLCVNLLAASFFAVRSPTDTGLHVFSQKCKISHQLCTPPTTAPVLRECHSPPPTHPQEENPGNEPPTYISIISQLSLDATVLDELITR